MAWSGVKFDPALLAAFLRERHPVKTAERVAAEAGVPVGTVRQWLKGAALPGFLHFCALIGAYGPQFLAALLPGVGWLDVARRVEEQRALEAEITAAQQRFADLTRRHDEKGMAAARGGGAGERGAPAGAAPAGEGDALGAVRRLAGAKG